MPGMVVVQHMPPVFTKMFADRLNNELPFEVREAEDNVLIAPNSIHIAPGDRHLRIQKQGPFFYTRLGGAEKISGHCPSVDALFSSVAETAGPQAVGIILTGMGADGAQGLLRMRKKGAFTIGQDESTSVVYGMPCKAQEIGAVSVQAPLMDVAKILLTFLNKV
jgi:two-component system chemotaxis response regulator CheB